VEDLYFICHVGFTRISYILYEFEVGEDKKYQTSKRLSKL